MDKQIIAKYCIDKRGDRTKYQLGKLAGLSIGQIERIERAEKNYTVDMLGKYLTALGAKVSIK